MRLYAHASSLDMSSATLAYQRLLHFHSRHAESNPALAATALRGVAHMGPRAPDASVIMALQHLVVDGDAAEAAPVEVLEALGSLGASMLREGNGFPLFPLLKRGNKRCLDAVVHLMCQADASPLGKPTPLEEASHRFFVFTHSKKKKRPRAWCPPCWTCCSAAKTMWET